MSEWVETLADRMSAAGVSVTDLASVTKLHPSAIHRLLNGETTVPQAKTMRVIDAALEGVTASPETVRTLRAEVAELREVVQQLQAASQQQLQSLQLVQSMLQHLLADQPGRPPRR